MYTLASEAGGRWAQPIRGWTQPISAETKSTELFHRYIQSVERTCDLITFRLAELLDPRFRQLLGERYWYFELDTISHFLGEMGTTTMEELAPEDHEGLTAFYKLYAQACRKAEKAIDDYLAGPGTEVAIREAVAVLEAHNDARDTYLESIDFPAWL